MKNKDLILAAAVVAGSNHAAWVRLLETLKAHAEQSAANCVYSPSDEVHMAQGAAREARFIYDTFATCREEAAKMQNTSKG